MLPGQSGDEWEEEAPDRHSGQERRHVREAGGHSRTGRRTEARYARIIPHEWDMAYGGPQVSWHVNSFLGLS